MHAQQIIWHAGLKVGWEKRGPDGLVSWVAAAPGDGGPQYEGKGRGKLEPDLVLGITRDPLRIIGSIRHRILGRGDGDSQTRNRMLDYARAHVELEDGTDLQLAVRFYVAWNGLCDQQAPRRWFRMDSNQDQMALQRMARRLASQHRQVDRPPHNLPSQSVNAWGPHPNPTWAEILASCGQETTRAAAAIATARGYRPKD